MTGGNQPRSSGGRLASGAACFTMFSPSSCTGAASLGDGALTWCLRCTAIHSDIEPSGFAVTVGAGRAIASCGLNTPYPYSGSRPVAPSSSAEAIKRWAS